MNEVIREFLIETNENLAQLDIDLVTLEKDPTERETLARVFRTLHTVKGTAGFLGLQKLQAVAHAAENLLGKLREGKFVFNAEIASALLTVVDAVRKMLEAVEASETDGTGDFSALIATLERLNSGVAGGATVVAAQVAKQAPAPAIAHAGWNSRRDRSCSGRPVPVVGHGGVGAASGGRVASDRPSRIARFAWMWVSGQAHESRGRVGPGPQSDRAVQHVSGKHALSGNRATLEPADDRIAGGRHEDADAADRHDLEQISPRRSRLGAGLRQTGADRNGGPGDRAGQDDYRGHPRPADAPRCATAIDHGIEPPAERQARGKAAEGRLALHAFHEGGKVIIEIADDGAGIDPQRIRSKAIQAKLVTPEQADRLNDRDLVNLIFLPGFSTADRVTQFSGRGVGMDVVRTNIEKIGGSVTIDSRPGEGTTVRMKIPLTLAIIPALTITSAGDRYAIPQVSLLELVRLEGEQAQRGIEQIQGAPVYRLRGNLLPLVYLNDQLRADRDQSPTSSTKEQASRRMRATVSPINIVVLQADDRQFGLVVDAIHDTEEIVVKPLQKQLKGLSTFAGATIMGDGRVALILDVLGLAQRANVVSGVRERALSEEPARIAETAGDRQTVLLFATHDGGRMAIPLSQVARLEEFPRSSLEHVGPRDVVQYRDEILPLIHASRTLGSRRNSTDDGSSSRRRARTPPRRMRATPCRWSSTRVRVGASVWLSTAFSTSSRKR